MSFENDFKIDLHTHTLASGHAYNTMNEMVAAAQEKNITHLGITEHAPSMPGTCHEFYFQNLRVVPRKRDGLQLILGSEANIIDFEGNIDLSEFILGRLDVVIASMHIVCIKPGTMEENTAAYVGAMKNKRVNIIGHPDDERFPVDYETLVKTAKETHTLLEINNNSLRPTGPRKNSRENVIRLLQLCKQYDVPVIFGSDAHIADDIANFGMIIPLVKEMDFPEELVVNRSYEALAEFL